MLLSSSTQSVGTAFLLTAIPFAQAQFSEELWKIGAQFGFNALLVVWLLYSGNREREKQRNSIDLLTRGVTEMILAQAFLPKPFHDHAREIKHNLEENNK